jgi:streptogramin lyase
MDPDHVIRNEKKWLQSMAFDSQNNVYVGWIMGGAIAKFDRATKKVSVFPIPTHNAIPYGHHRGQKRQHVDCAVGLGQHREIRHAQQPVHDFAPPTYPSQIRRSERRRAEQHLVRHVVRWNPTGRLGKIDQTTGRITEYVVPRRNANPYDVAQDGMGTCGSRMSEARRRQSTSSTRVTNRSRYIRKPQRAADTPKIQITRDGAIWYSPRGSQDAPAFGRALSRHGQDHDARRVLYNGPPGYPFKPGGSNATK